MVGNPTTLIGPKAAQTNYYAAEQARRIGLPLTYWVTINYGSTKIDPREAVPAFSKLRRHHFNKWATRPGKDAGKAFPPTGADAFENVLNGVPFLTMAPGDPNNVHEHWAVQLTENRVHDYKNMIWNWVERTTGGITGGEETILLDPITGTISYSVKGTTPTLIRLYGRGQKAEPQGIIIGRRADTTRNLGPTARRNTDQKLGIRRQMPFRKSRAPSSFHAP